MTKPKTHRSFTKSLESYLKIRDAEVSLLEIDASVVAIPPEVWEEFNKRKDAASSELDSFFESIGL